MYKSYFNKGPFKSNRDICKPIHFEPPREQPLVQSMSLKENFYKGPFKSNRDVCKPIHFEPPKENPKNIKNNIPWKQASFISKKLFTYNVLNYNII